MKTGGFRCEDIGRMAPGEVWAPSSAWREIRWPRPVTESVNIHMVGDLIEVYPMVGGPWIFKSEDGGQTWTEATSAA